MKEEILEVVDENDKLIRTAPRNEVFENALTHRSANVIVFNKEGKIFIHQRAESMNPFPSMWDVKFGGVLRAGETYEECARRELNEEASIEGVELEYMFFLKLRTENYNSNKKVYICTYDGEIRLDPEEVQDGKFASVEEAVKMKEKGMLSLSAVQVLNEYLKK